MFQICVWKHCYKEWAHRKKEHCVLIFIYSAALRLSRDILLLPYIFIFRRKLYAEKNLGCWREEERGEKGAFFSTGGEKLFSSLLYRGREQWVRRLEGWPNTAARLADWRRETRHVWFCPWWTGHTACLFSVPYRLPWLGLPSCELMEISAAVI
jgi:hypothetical protein